LHGADRSDVYHCASALLFHLQRKRSRDAHRSHYVQIPKVLPFLIRGVGHRLVGPSACIRYEDISPAGALSRRYDSVAAVDRRHIRGYSGRLDLVLVLDVGGNPLNLALGARRKDDTCAFSCKRTRDAKTNPLAAAGDNNNFIFQFQIHSSLLGSRGCWPFVQGAG